MTLTKFVRTTAAAIGALAVATQVNAADIYAGGGMKDVPAYAPAPLWTGFYIGGHLGADWANVNTDRNRWWDGACVGGTCTGTYSPYWGGDSLNTTGAFGGVQLGYNWQSANFLLGLEVDLGGAATNFDAGYAGYVGGDSLGIRVQSEGGFYGDVTGRLGYTWGPALLYAKGGFAWLDTDFKVTTHAHINTGGGVYSDTFGSWTHNDTLTGWTVGGGLEYMLSPSWTMKVEYLFFDFNNFDNNWNWDTTTYNNWRFNNAALEVNTVKLGFNYIFNRGYAPLK